MTRIHGRVDANHPAIVDALRAAGCHVYSLADVGRGVPDLLVWSPVTCQLYLLEVKAGNKRLTTAEQAWHDAWPGPVYVVRSVEDALRVVGRMDADSDRGQ